MTGITKDTTAKKYLNFMCSPKEFKEQ